MAHTRFLYLPRTLWVLLLVVALVAIEVGSLATPVKAQAPLRFDGVEVKALIFRSLDTDYIIKTLAPRLEKETGIKLTVDDPPYEDVRAKQLADRAGAKTFDIINPCTEWSYEYAQFTAPLDPYIGKAGYPNLETDDMIPFVWKAFNPGKEVKLLPYQPDTRIFFYRQDLLKAAGINPPTTWDELLSAAEKLTTGKQYGFVFPGQRGWNLTLAWIPFVYSAGGDIFVDGKPAFNSKAGVDALNLLIKLKKFAPPDVTAYGEHEVNQSVIQGNMAMGVSASAITPEIEAADSPVKGKVLSTTFPLQSKDVKPKFTAALGGWSLGVADYSKNKDAAAYTIMWLTSRPIVTEMQIHGRQHAARLSMAKNAELLAVNPHVPTIVKILEGAEIFYRGPEGAALGELVNVRISQAIAGELTPEKALEMAEKDVNDYLAKK